MDGLELRRAFEEGANTTPEKAAAYRDRYPLTARQRDVLNALETFQAEGKAPSLHELCAAVGLRSTFALRRHLAILQKKGLAKRDFDVPRSIRLAEAA